MKLISSKSKFKISQCHILKVTWLTFSSYLSKKKFYVFIEKTEVQTKLYLPNSHRIKFMELLQKYHYMFLPYPITKGFQQSLPRSWPIRGNCWIAVIESC